MSLDLLLSRLTKVRGGNGSWTACCPAHEDRTPSLSIREDGGRILLHCHAGCDVLSIVNAVQLDLGDLFPPKPEPGPMPPNKRVRFFASDVMRCLHAEALVVMVAAYNVKAGVKLTDEDYERLGTAWRRIDEAMESVNG
jgi:hypothetical protein